MTTKLIAVDTNVLVALVDARDKWHEHALLLARTLLASETQLIYFDCVLNEAIGVIGRRTEEQKRPEQFGVLLTGLVTAVPIWSITWISGATARLFPQLFDLCRQHEGRLNMNDALIVRACEELGINYLLSFDTDFDSIPGLVRLGDLTSVQTLV